MFKILLKSYENIKEIFNKNKLIENCLIWQKRAKNISGDSTTVSSQFQIVNLKSNCHVKYQSCNSLLS